MYNDYQNATASFCTHCGAALAGPFCTRCGARREQAGPPAVAVGGWATAYIPPKKRSVGVWIVVGGFSLLAAAFLVFCFVLALYGSLSYSNAESSSEYSGDYDYYDDYGGYGGYGGGMPFDFSFGYRNETEYVRVDPTGTVRSTGTEEFPAPEGKEYLIVNLRITNLYDDLMPYDTADFELGCGEGNLIPALYTDIDRSTALGYGRLLPGGKVDGSVVFLIPKGDLSLVLYMYDYNQTISFPLL